METSGSGNRVAARDYLEFNFSQLTDAQPLVPAQRQQLNSHIKGAAAALRQEPQQIWRHVHAVLGVESVNDITRDQYQSALQSVDDYLNSTKQSAACQKLVGQILRTATDKGIQEPMENFCLGAFGMDRLKELGREELAQVYAFVEQYPTEGDSPPKLQRHLQSKSVRVAALSSFVAGLLLGLLI